jgi:hypothetical protein
MSLVQLFFVHNQQNAFLVLFTDIFRHLVTIPVAQIITDIIIIIIMKIR